MFFSRIALLFYITVLILFSCFLIILAAQWVELEHINELFFIIYYEPQVRVITGLTAIVLLFLNYLFYQIISGHQQKEKTIAFDNPSGRVSVSLSVLEDLVRRLMTRYPEIKEVRPNIKATKKGLEISAKIILKSEVNIPELTSDLQEAVRKRIQETVGLEETVTVKLHVTRIISTDKNVKNQSGADKGRDKDETFPNIPFQGYRA